MFRQIVELANVMGWLCDVYGSCTYLSPAWLKYTGLERGLGMDWVEAVHPEDRQKMREAYFAAVDAHSEYSSEFRLRRAEGAHGMVLSFAKPLFEDDRYCGHWGVVLTRDIYSAATGVQSDIQFATVLTSRERELLALFAQGYTTETAALSLGIAEGTVSVHANRAAQKLGALNRTHAVVLALQRGELPSLSAIAPDASCRDDIDANIA